VKRSLSVFVPIHDTYRWLDSIVSELLEVLPELTPRFEVLLLDDGDAGDGHAVETGHELALRYPQVRVVRPALATGRAATLRAGLSRSQGEVVLLWSDGCLIEPHGFRKLWRMINEYAAVIAHATPAAKSRGGWAQRLASWGMRGAESNPKASASGLYLLHRQVAERLWTEAASHEELPAALSRRGYRWCELELRPAGASRPEPTLAEVGLSRGDHLRADRAASTASSGRRAADARRPKYLSRLRDFALGE
jgi:hypothetical protein